MNIKRIMGMFVLVLVLGFSPIQLAAVDTNAHETITPAFSDVIANVPNKTITALIVDYQPGGKSASHRHGSAFVVAYVLSGAIRSKVNDEEEKIYHAGQSWTENPGDYHVISENASEREPAKLLAVFIADSKEKTLVFFDK